ncbi:MAG: hypothetical protein FJW38_10090 [Acidobacteria bacterium]|nr:hypothetical protein [Acidobacteriota bacterium]
MPVDARRRRPALSLEPRRHRQLAHHLVDHHRHASGRHGAVQLRPADGCSAPPWNLQLHAAGDQLGHVGDAGLLARDSAARPAAAPPGPAITACPSSSAVIGTSYSQTLSTTGTAPVTLSLQSGSLPVGLLLTGNTISGTPSGPAGTSNFTLLATDSGNPVQTGTRACSITVSNAPPPPVAPTITTACPLPSGQVGTPVHINLTATGDSPISWSITNGTLPLGVTLASNGTLSGVPHHNGTFQFTLRAANNTGSALLTCT